MGVKEVKIRFCDHCGKEIIGRLTLHTCPCCGKDICVECQTKEDNRHKPRERKSKPEQVSPPVEITPELKELEEGLNSEGLALKKRGRKPSKDKPTPILTSPHITSPDISTDKPLIKLTITEPAKETPFYRVSIGEVDSIGATKKDALIQALSWYNGKIPVGLSAEDKKTLQGILDE